MGPTSKGRRFRKGEEGEMEGKAGGGEKEGKGGEGNGGGREEDREGFSLPYLLGGLDATGCSLR